MNYRQILTLLLLFLTVAVTAPAVENRTRDFGPSAGPHIVFTTPSQKDRRSIEQLDRLAGAFDRAPPPLRVSLVVTEDDFSDLPEDIRTDWPAGTRKEIAVLEEDEAAAVFILLPGDGTGVRITNGSRGKTAPRWILERTIRVLESKGIDTELAEYRMPLYRLGWLPENPILGAWLQADRPAIILETGADIAEALAALAASFETGIPADHDRHFLVAEVRNRAMFVGEGLMVAIMIAASAVILLFLFIFSFLLGKKSDQHLRDLFHVWWLPFIYFAVNILCLYVAQAIAAGLFGFRFGTDDAWTLLPRVALCAKLIIAWFFITLIMSLNQLIRFPEDNFIYGYIASIVCMINIFVFGSLDFSLSILFLAVYAISFLAYHFRHPASQVVWIAVLFIPFIPYVGVLARGWTGSVGPLYTGETWWNLRMALFVMPFQLLVSKLFHTVGIFGRKYRFYLPVNLIASLVATICAMALVLFMPAWSPQRPLSVPVRQTITDGGSSLSTTAPVRLRSLRVTEDEQLAASAPEPTAESFVRVSVESRGFLERQLVSLTVEPLIPVQKVEITVTSANGMSVYDASLPFEQRDGGRESRFVSGENPELPYAVAFSSDRNSDLTATIRAWTRENPYGIAIANGGITTDYLLEVVRAVALPSVRAVEVPGGPQ